MSEIDAEKPDDDLPEMDEEWFATARPFREMPPAGNAAGERRRGRPPLAEPKRAVSLRLDARIVDHLRSGGAGWQTRVNKALAELIAGGRL